MNVIVLPPRGLYEESEELEAQFEAATRSNLKINSASFPGLTVDVWAAVGGASVERIDIVGHGSPGALRISNRRGGLLYQDERKSVTGLLGLQQFFPLDNGKRRGELRLLGCNTGTGRSLLVELERRMGGVRVIGTNRGITSDEFVDGLFPTDSSVLVGTSHPRVAEPQPPRGEVAVDPMELGAATWRVGDDVVAASNRDELVAALGAPIVLGGSLLTLVRRGVVGDFGDRTLALDIASDRSGIVVRGDAEVHFHPFDPAVDLARRNRLIDRLGAF